MFQEPILLNRFVFTDIVKRLIWFYTILLYTRMIFCKLLSELTIFLSPNLISSNYTVGLKYFYDLAQQ